MPTSENSNPATTGSSSASSTHNWEDMVGSTLIQNTKSSDNKSTNKDGNQPEATSKYTILPTIDALKNKELILFYFSASWCPPCQSFSPVLKSFYKHVQDQIEIIYISSDKSIDQFDQYFGTMPWLSLPVGGTTAYKSALAQSMHISGIPALVVLTRQGGLFVTDQARQQVTTCMRNNSSSTAQATAAKELVRQWKEDITAVSLNEAKMGSSGGPTGIMGLITSLFKHPVAIMALVYFVKWAFRRYQTLTRKENQVIDDIAGQDAGEEPEF